MQISPYSQLFSIPLPIIRYLIQNVYSVKTLKKMLFSCKYFFLKKPVLIGKGLVCKENNSCFHFNRKTFEFENLNHKVWLYGTLYSLVGQLNISKLMPKVYRCDVAYLTIREQHLSYDDYLFLTSSQKLINLEFEEVEIKYLNGNFVPLEEILKNLPNLKHFNFGLINGSMLFPNTVPKIIEYLSAQKRIILFSLTNVCGAFDFATFAEYLEKETREFGILIEWNYRFQFSTEYKAAVQRFINNKKNKCHLVTQIREW